MDAVLETYEARDFTIWPVAGHPEGRFLSLSADLSPRQVGTAMAVLTTYNKGLPRKRGERLAVDGMHQVRRLLTAECVVAPGGLRVRDTVTGVTASPGCCFGLESWRDWLDLLKGEEPWLGHDPAPQAEHVGEVIRLWPDAARQEGLPIDIPRAELRGLLGGVRGDLAGFLNSAERWASCRFAPVTAALVATLDESLAVSAPWGDSP